MSAFIVYFIPSLISAILEEKVLNKSLKIKEGVINYLIYCLFNNIITHIIMIFVFKVKYHMEQSINSYLAVTVKYAYLAIIVSILLTSVKINLIINMLT